MAGRMARSTPLAVRRSRPSRAGGAAGVYACHIGARRRRPDTGGPAKMSPPDDLTACSSGTMTVAPVCSTVSLAKGRPATLAEPAPGPVNTTTKRPSPLIDARRTTRSSKKTGPSGVDTVPNRSTEPSTTATDPAWSPIASAMANASSGSRSPPIRYTGRVPRNATATPAGPA